ncbi:MAG: ComF family protein [Methylobacter sp.]|nr:ComF family protein [Methylobacter sp.]
MKMVYNWINIIQDYLLPPTCILCGNSGSNSRDICSSCYTHLPRNNLCCYRCAEILETPTVAPVLCGRCLSRHPAFDETYAPFIHQGAIRHLISTLKFGANYKNARLLGMLLAEHLKQTAERPNLILPIPLHKARYRQRGFNQAIEIARTVSRELQIPLDLTSCHRHRDTPHQTDLSAKKRRKNLKNAFSLIKPIPAQHIAILDDVMTTGSTAHELAYLLKKAGVSRVDVWVCARA